tara:strand:+ start:843 stop:1142 length:300 start_codon:yes stop_codon:yes gene_type:complete
LVDDRGHFSSVALENIKRKAIPYWPNGNADDGITLGMGQAKISASSLVVGFRIWRLRITSETQLDELANGRPNGYRLVSSLTILVQSYGNAKGDLDHET